MRSAAAGPIAWRIAGTELRLERPVIMGVLNVTPDSFSDSGRYLDPGRAVAHAAAMAEAGADLIDVGGESTRPGAAAVSAREEAGRVLPVLEAIRREIDLPLSVDTSKPEVAERALDAGAAVINDVSGGRDPGMRGLVARSGAGFVVMHMRGTPRTMGDLARYGNVVEEVVAELRDRVEALERAGCDRRALVLDPGIGFSKTPEQSMRLIREVGRLGSLGLPILLGPSRKSFLAAAGGGATPELRLGGTLAACVLGLSGGARIFRVHDVADARRALDTARAILDAGQRVRGPTPEGVGHP